MHEEKREDGFLTGASDIPPHPEGDPLAAVKAVSEPRANIGGGLLPEAHGEENAKRREDGVMPQSLSEQSETAADKESGYGDFDWPDGYVADPRAMSRFIPLARKLGLPRESAQELACLYAELDQDRQRAQSEFIAKNNAEWLKEIHSHPEFGNHNLQRTTEDVAATMRRFGTPLLLAQVRQMNIQNWPEMFFFLARISQAVSEDCSPSGGNADAPVKSTAQLLFPGLK